MPHTAASKLNYACGCRLLSVEVTLPTKSFSMSQPCGTIMPLMAALSGLPRGQTQTSAGRFGMSGLPPIADIVRLHAQVRSVPCVDGSELARTFFAYAGLVGA